MHPKGFSLCWISSGVGAADLYEADTCTFRNPKLNEMHPLICLLKTPLFFI